MMLRLNIFKNLSLVFLGLLLAFLPSTGVSAEALLSKEDSSSPALQIDKQAEEVKIKQLSQAELREEKNSLEKRKLELKKEVNYFLVERDRYDQTTLLLQKELQKLKSDQSDTQNTLEGLNQDQNKQPNQPNSLNQINLVDTKLQEAKNRRSQAEVALIQKQAELKAVEQKLKTIQSQLKTEKQEVRDSVSELRSDFLSLTWNFFGYILLITAYWAIFSLLKKMLKNSQLSLQLKSVLSLVLIVCCILATAITLIIAFLGNLSFIFTGLGVLSAALVVALQDFISSFFAWIIIKTKNQINEGDVISIVTHKGLLTGIVKEVGVFRTAIREQVGGQGIDSERLTGNITYFPNNLALKQPISNFNDRGKIRWHQLDILTKHGDDYQQARKTLQRVCRLHHKNLASQNTKKPSAKLTPKIYMAINDSGIQFTIWFASRVGLYRESLEDISKRVLDEFEAEGINFNYPSSRIVY